MSDPSKASPEMKLEVVPIPVADVNRAKTFYEKAGFRLDVDTKPNEGMRVVQLTPPALSCSELACRRSAT